MSPKASSTANVLSCLSVRVSGSRNAPFASMRNCDSSSSVFGIWTTMNSPVQASDQFVQCQHRFSHFIASSSIWTDPSIEHPPRHANAFERNLSQVRLLLSGPPPWSDRPRLIRTVFDSTFPRVRFLFCRLFLVLGRGVD